MPFRNATESLQRFRNLRTAYDTAFEPLIQELRTQYATTRARKAKLDESLEAHIRAYLINSWLHALNWRLDVAPETGLPNMVPEAAVAPLRTGHLRFLDYFGFEKAAIDRPLLVVETKRTASPPPQLRSPVVTASSDQETVARGLRGESMMGDWNAWLNDLGDYVKRVHARVQAVPKRAVITNGRWLILFLDPADSFLPGGSQSQEAILAYANLSEVERRYSELFRHLEHSALSGIAEPLQPAEVAFHVDPAAVTQVMHGLRVRYVATSGNVRGPTPVIKVVPWLFVGAASGTWISVRGDDDLEVPTRRADFLAHLAEVETAARSLLGDVNTNLGLALQPTTIEAHYAAGLPGLAGVREVERELYLVATGQHTHYFRATPTVAGCSWHSWADASNAQLGVPDGPYLRGRVIPRSFFHQPEVQFCAHNSVRLVKSTPLGPANRGRCGTRSGEDGQPFCEVWAFEQQMCCRTCVFEPVCEAAQVFRLPCPEAPGPIAPVPAPAPAASAPPPGGDPGQPPR